MCAIRWLLISSLVAITACGDNLKGLAGDDTVGPTGPECHNGIDDDGDGDIDFPDDLGCDDAKDETENSPPKPRCSDHRDNDADGKMDFPLDPGCSVASDDDETDDCPSGPNCPQCSNDKDDDFNGVTDYPDDEGCNSAGDTAEFVDDPNACGVGLKIKPLPASGVDQGMLDVTSASNLMTTCGGGGGAPGIAYVLLLTEPKVIVASTDDPITTADTNLSIRSGNCTETTAVMGCNDNISATNRKSSLTVSLPPGTYYLIVEGYDAVGMGAYKLTVQQFAGEGATCTMQSDCGPGLLCRIPVGQTTMVCAKPVCDDGLDDDADGKIDYPNDPGCTNSDDATEDDTCPNGPGCPQCGDGIDNDGDTNIDFPADLSCTSASGNSESCNGEQDPISNIVTGVNNGTLVGAHDDHDPTCGSNLGPDVLFTLTVPKMATLRLSTEGSVITDTVLSVMTSTCTEPGLACDDDSGITPPLSSVINMTNVLPGTYIVAVDAYNNTTVLNTFVLAVTGTIGAGGSCETPLFTSGAFTCQAGLVCQGPMNAKICSSECSDGVDNNGDGKIDFPNDPGCQAPNDNSETTVCPGAACPQCADGVDNDGDTMIDYPLDTTCTSASGSSETCPGEQDPIATIVTGMNPGTLVGSHDDHNPSCVATDGADVLYALPLPAMATLRLSTEGSATLDTVLSLMASTCGEPSLLCDDNTGVTPANSAIINATNLAAGNYFVAVDAFNAATVLSTYLLTVTGTIAAHGSCETPLFTSGAFTCAAGLTCMGTPGMRTCQSECSDGLDNNGDGKIDFPNDPGCTAPNDPAEDTVCPGATCPACSDGLDNDADGQTDYPLDPSCASASGGSEQCNGEQDPIQNIVASVNNGTLVGAHDDHNPSCTTPDAPDVLFTLTVPAMASLRLSTEGSAILDTVLSLMTATCAEPSLACDDDSGITPANSSVINTTNLAAGNYVVAVDQYSTFVTPNTFVLTVTGTIAPNGSCATPLFTSGAIACSAGQTCTAGTCQ